MKRRLFALRSVVCLVLLCAAGCRSAAPPSEAPRPTGIGAGRFERTMEPAVDGQALSYILHVPAADERPERGWPVLLFLHGAGERGDDLALVEVHGPPKLTNTIPELARCVLVAPQCPTGGWWKAGPLEGLLDEVRSLVEVDDERLYITGLSMGGYGSWGLLARYPDLFAAAVPICGGGDIARLWPERGEGAGFDLEGLLRAKDVPIRAFHGDADSVVPADESRILVRALEAAGADVELTVYPGVGHDSWTRTYADTGLYEWLFAQRRGTR